MDNPIQQGGSTYQFRLKRDAYGIREAISLDNEAGCPFKCNGCGVYQDAKIVSSETNRQTIDTEVAKLQQNREKYQADYAANGSHVIVYNSGSVTSPKELSRDNLDYLLQSIDRLNPKPKVVALNTRGAFVDTSLLDHLTVLGLGYRVDFNFGLETRSERGKGIYGKQSIDQEFKKFFSTVHKQNQGNGTEFGLMINFVYLPESYLFQEEQRDGNKEKIKQGFISEISDFIEQFANKGVPLRINLHPFYHVKGIDLEDSNLDEFMEAAEEIWRAIDEKNKSIEDPKMKVSAYIGVQDNGYETESWKNQIKRWQEIIDQMNRGELIVRPGD